MKKNFKYAILSAIALVGAVSFSACQSSDDLGDVNPTYDGESVKTQFTISLPWDKTAATRQSSDVVQQAQTIAKFRGMQNIVLIPFFSATARDTRLGENINLAANTIVRPDGAANTEANSIPEGSKLLAGSNAVLYNDVTIPVSTSAFIFYGKAKGEDGFENGYLTAAGLTGETSEISFSPTPIKLNPVTTTANALAAYVTAIAAAADDTDTGIAWYKCALEANKTEAWYSAALGQLYTNFTSMKPGASSYIKAAVQDLYTSVYRNTDKISKAITKAILTKATDAGSTGILTFDSSLDGYPGTDNNSMPEGAAALTWTTTTTAAKSATAVTESNFGSDVSGFGVIKMRDIVYPASLYYYVDSDIKTSNTSRIADYTTTDSWATILGKYTSGNEVSTATRSVAITKPIQYAVGRLDATVSALSESNYYDRKGEKVTIPDAGFQLTGVLIGGQKVVDYQFVPVTTTGAKEYTIYDKTINPSTSAYVTKTTAAGPNYTLALETAQNTAVYIALEFMNNSTKDFQGIDGIVKAGCKFYMIAKLDPTSNVATGNTVSNVNNTGNRVFKQDFNTIVTFTIGAGSPDNNNDGDSDDPKGFANAYTTIPDLRTPQLELGFSVNLEWQPGITFTYTF